MAQVKQGRTASSYEFKVLRVNDWMVEQEHDPFCHVVEVSPQRYRVELLADDGAVRSTNRAWCARRDTKRVHGVCMARQPRVPSVEAVIEFLIGMTTGDVEKGGSRVARDKDWYASPMQGKTQAELCMPEDKKGKYGWGPFKDLPYRLGIIEQHATALRQWLQVRGRAELCCTRGGRCDAAACTWRAGAAARL